MCWWTESQYLTDTEKYYSLSIRRCDRYTRMCDDDGVCVCVFSTRWPRQWEASREDERELAGPHVRAHAHTHTRRVSAPWPGCIFSTQSYIGMISTVQLISLSSSARTDLNIREIGCSQKRKGVNKIICIYKCLKIWLPPPTPHVMLQY